ncbi:PilC/PilY family type IV pilus protein [Hydrogenophaga sp. 5NK40-0174]
MATRGSTGVAVFAALVLGAHLPATAQVNPADKPLFLSSSVDPNIMFVLDDSGSMHWEVTPDDYIRPRFVFRPVAGMYGGADYDEFTTSVRYNAANADERTTARAYRSFALNKSYYNPAVTYRPWAREDGSLFPNANPTAAFHHPIRTGLGTRNLTVNTTENTRWIYRNQTGGLFWSEVGSGWRNATHYPAVYFRHNGGALWDAANYTQVNIIASTTNYTGDGRENRTDCVAGNCTYAQEIQNFANWYTYYRSRMLAAQAGIGRAFSAQSDSMRVGFGAINKDSSSVDGVNTETVIRGVRKFDGADRTAFFNELYGGVWNPANTPLRRALDDVGQYFSRTDNRGPWGARPGINDSSDHLQCRQSFSILMTDGYWNSSQASTAAARQNVDNTSGPTITDAGPPVRSFQYSPGTPFSDVTDNTLADVAMYYWNQDLRPSLPNKVPTTDENPAFWQHMVTYGVGLGVSGTIDPDTAFGAIDASPAVNITWPDPESSNPAKIDDLLHAGVNSRGGFFSAGDPETFANELTSVLSNIVARVTSAGTSAAASSSTLQTDTLIYNASFRSTDWSGTVEARNLDAYGAPDKSAAGLAWDAEQVLAARTPASRNIYTSAGPGSPVPLLPAALSTAQTTALGINPGGAPASAATASDRVNWLRGADHPELRSRVVDGVIRRVGDIISSDPQFMYQRDFGYTLLPGTEGTSYKTFRNSTAYKSRPEVLMVGTNGGMYHGFEADTGVELFAYVPSELLLPGSSGTHAQINDLMRTDYDHRYYVDGASIVSDVYTGGQWRTAAVGTMGAGGRTVFALDVSDPTSFSASDVMWEFKYAPNTCVADPSGTGGSTACRDIGYGVTNPKVVRMANGRWAAVFGNGYNSFDHRARLMVVDMQSGRLMYNLLVPDNVANAGSASATNPNGLSPVETTDWPNNNLMMANAYAGDLLGNMWRFDFTGTSPSIRRIFTAVDGSDVRQPILARPRLALKPGSTSEIVVLFGTGSYFRLSDDTSTQVQTFYGIFDSPSSTGSPPSRSSLLAQTITSNMSAMTVGSITYEPGTLRSLSQLGLTNQPGWRVDLPVSGERVVSEGVFPSGPFQKSIRFTTLVPELDPCGSGRSGYLMDMDLLSGGRSSEAAFDINGDGEIDGSDAAYSGLKGGSGQKPLVIRNGNGGDNNPPPPPPNPNPNDPPPCTQDCIYDEDGNLITSGSNTAGPLGRQSWRQLR